MKKIILIPYGGLCNRMRVMASGIVLAHNLDMELEIIWNKIAECYVRFDELFLPIPNLLESDGHEFKWPSVKNLWLPLIKGKLDLSRTYNWDIAHNTYGGFFGKVLKSTPSKSSVDFKKKLKKNENVIVTCQSLATEYDFSIFTPNSWHLEVVENIVSGFVKETYGMHIRRSDNMQSVKGSPDELFRLKIAEILEQNPSAKFYVSSDDRIIKDDLKKRFGESIITYNAELSRASENGMKDALIELLVLSKTKKIFGSWWSSYSEMAAKIGNIDLEILKKEA